MLEPPSAVLFMVTERRLVIYIRLSAPFKERASQREFTIAHALGNLPMSVTKPYKAKLNRMIIYSRQAYLT